MNDQQYPPGWDQTRVQRLIAHYQSLDDDAMIAEDEAAHEDDGLTTIVIPTE